MSHRTVEKKEERRVSSTALGKRKSIVDGATSRPTPARTPGLINQAARGERSPAFSERNSTGTAADQQQASSSTENVGSTPTVSTCLGPAGKQNKHHGSAVQEETSAELFSLPQKNNRTTDFVFAAYDPT